MRYFILFSLTILITISSPSYSCTPPVNGEPSADCPMNDAMAQKGDTLATSHEMRRKAIETCIMSYTKRSTITNEDIQAHGIACTEAVGKKIESEGR